MNNLKIQELLDSPCTSYWLKDALRSALNRDCVDAAADAEVLAAVLTLRAEEILGRTPKSSPARCFSTRSSAASALAVRTKPPAAALKGWRRVVSSGY